MSEARIEGFYRELASSEFGWQADMSDELHADESLAADRIDHVLLDGHGCKYTIITWRELDKCLEAAGIARDGNVENELNDHIKNALPETYSQPIKMATEPIEIVVPGCSRNKRKGQSRHDLRIGRSPVVAEERRAAMIATLQFCGFSESPEGVWLPSEHVNGFMIARGRSASEKKIVEAARLILNRTGKNSLLPRFVELDPVT